MGEFNAPLLCGDEEVDATVLEISRLRRIQERFGHSLWSVGEHTGSIHPDIELLEADD